MGDNFENEPHREETVLFETTFRAEPSFQWGDFSGQESGTENLDDSDYTHTPGENSVAQSTCGDGQGVQQQNVGNFLEQFVPNTPNPPDWANEVIAIDSD